MARMHTNKHRDKQSGMAYVALLILLAILSALGFAFLFKVGTLTSATETRGTGMQANYLAETAANHAMWRLLNEATSTVERRVNHGDDDAEEDDAGDIRLDFSELELGRQVYVGVRFLNVQIPQGATITDARVEFKATVDTTDPTHLQIQGEDTDNAPRFMNVNNDITDRPKTTSVVMWNNIPNWTEDELYQTPDLISIIQEIVDRPGWSSGNAMAIFFRSTDLNGLRRAFAYDGILANAPSLHVQYGDATIAASNIYYMHSLAGGRYGYKIRRHTETTFATIATVGAVGENVVHQSYVLHVLPRCAPGNFRDEFNTVAYNNCDGNLAWAGDWIELDASGTGPSAGKVVITDGELRMYGTPYGDDPSLAREVDLSGHQFATLSFSFRTGAGVDAGEDSAVVEVSGDGGGSWTVLEDFIGAGGSAAGTCSYDISTYVAADTRVRFRINLLYGGPDEYFYVDDVEVKAICERTLCDNLVGYWRLDESSGSTSAWDSSENGNHGKLIEMDPLIDWVPGHLEGALDFDGVDDSVDLGSDWGVDNIFDGGATISAWIYPRGWGENEFGRILDKADNLGTNRNGWAFELYGARRSLLLQRGFVGGIGNWVTPDDSISLNTWQHVAVVYNSSSYANDPALYINGVPQTVMEIDTPSGVPRSDAAINLTLGNYALDTNRTWDGLIDDVRIYNRMLDSDEIARLHAMTEGACGPIDNNPPVVEAGPDQILDFPTVETVLDGMVADDGLPDPPKAVTKTWSTFSGPGTVTFDDPSQVDSNVSFSEQGTYVLRLTADDSELNAFDEVTIELPMPCDGTYIDPFDNPVFNGSSGTLDWSTSPWVEVGESDGPASGDIQVSSDLGSNRLRLRDNDNGGEGVERQIDLSGASSAKLAFYYRRSGLDNANDYAKVEISANGAAGPWAELFRFQGPGTDADYQLVESDISAYASSNTRLRFLTSPNMGAVDIVWIDDVYIECGS